MEDLVTAELNTKSFLGVCIDAGGALTCDWAHLGKKEFELARLSITIVEELSGVIKRHQGLTTNDLFLEVSFVYADFTAALRKLENADKLLVGHRGRAKTYYPSGGM